MRVGFALLTLSFLASCGIDGAPIRPASEKTDEQVAPRSSLVLAFLATDQVSSVDESRNARPDSRRVS